MQSIFVQVPAYRDFELPKTIDDAIKNASGTVRLHFGVHNCVLFSGEIEVRLDLPSWAKLSLSESVAPLNIGLQLSRYIANEFYEGEDYYLQIDSHMRFVKDWDLLAIDNIKYCQSLGVEKPLPTMYPSNYGYRDDGAEWRETHTKFSPTTISFHEKPDQFKETLIPSQTAVATDDHCLYTPSVSGGCIFTSGDFSQVTPNKKIAFWGEELLIAARAFTHGFIPVTPRQHLVWHLYASNQPFSQMRRHHAWADFPAEWAVLDAESKAEYKRIFQDRIIGEGALGTERTLEEFEDFTGLDFATGTIVNRNHVPSAVSQ